MSRDRVSNPSRRRTLQLLAAGSTLPGLALAQPAASNGTRKVLRYAFQIAETGFDPIQLTDLYSRVITSHIFDGLYRYDYLARPYKVQPNTAAALPEHSADWRVWTIRLRPGIYFDNDPAFKGARRELVAQDYVYSFKRVYDPRWKAPSYASFAELRIVGMAALRDAALKNRTPFDYDTPVEGLRALDRYTLQVRCEEPKPRFIQTLTSGDLYGAVAREVVEAYGDKIMEKPVGTGPFRLAEWRRSSRIVLERNPNFRDMTYDAEPNADDAEGQALLARFKGRRLPMVDRVEVSVIEETQPRWLAFLQKTHDLLERLPNEFVNIAIPNNRVAPHLQKQGVAMNRALASDVTVTVFNMDSPVVGGYAPEKVALRRAICLATNIEQEIRLLRRGQAIPAQSNLMPHTYGFDAGFRSENGVFDLARARALLDVYGYVDRDNDGLRENPDGSPLTIEFSTQPDQLSRQLDELRRKDMGALGLRVEFKPAKWPENLKSARAGKFMVWGVASSAAAPDGQPALMRGYTQHIGGQNLSRFRNPEFDALFNRISVLEDGAERLALFDRAKRILLAYAPYKWGTHRIITDLTHPWLIGYRRPAYGNDWWAYVDIDAAHQARET
jgi:ABC-type transport system substrate-binding protein